MSSVSQLVLWSRSPFCLRSIEGESGSEAASRRQSGRRQRQRQRRVEGGANAGGQHGVEKVGEESRRPHQGHERPLSRAHPAGLHADAFRKRKITHEGQLFDRQVQLADARQEPGVRAHPDLEYRGSTFKAFFQLVKWWRLLWLAGQEFGSQFPTKFQFTQELECAVCH